MPFSNSLEEAKKLKRLGKFYEALTLLEGFQPQIPIEKREYRVNAFNEQSHCLWQIGQLSKARKKAQKALEIAEESPLYLVGKAEALTNLGRINREKGEIKQSETFYKKALDIREKIGDSEEISNSLNNLGVFYWHQGNLNKAEELLRRSLTFLEEIDSPISLANTRNNLALVFMQQGLFEQAEDSFNQCLKIGEKLGNTHQIAAFSTNLGEVFRLRGELEKAEEYYNKGLLFFEEIGHPGDIAISLNNLGIVCWKQGKIVKAKEFLLRAIIFKEQIGNPQSIAESRQYLSQVLLMLGSIDSATKQVQELNNLTKGSKLPDINVRYLMTSGYLKLEQGNLREAIDLGNQARTLAEKIPHFDLLIQSTELVLEGSILLYLLDEEKEHLVTCRTLLKEMESFSKRERLYGTYTESVFIQGLLYQADFDLKRASDTFHRAELLAEEFNLLLLAERSRKELKKSEKQLHKLKQTQKISIDTYEQTQLQEVLKYLKRVRNDV